MAPVRRVVAASRGWGASSTDGVPAPGGERLDDGHPRGSMIRERDVGGPRLVVRWSLSAVSVTGGVQLDRSEYRPHRGRVPLRPTLGSGYSVIVEPVGNGGEALALAALLCDQ